MFDVIVIGGSYAGMSAAMQVARGRRKVLVIDAGKRRNRFAKASHGFIGRDGHAPGDIAAEGRAQLSAYPEVTWVDGLAVSASGSIDEFQVEMGNGRRFAGRRIVLATGVEDILPDLPGLEAQWGTGAATCPYCHGYELDRGRIGVLATGPHSMHHAMMLPEWGRTTFFTNGVLKLGPEQAEELARRGTAVEPTAIRAITGEPGSPVVQLDDGRSMPLDGLFVATCWRLSSPLAEMLDCALDEGPLGPIVRTDALKQTSVEGVFACGDAARFQASVALSVGDGALAGASAHRSIIFPPVRQAA